MKRWMGLVVIGGVLIAGLSGCHHDEHAAAARVEQEPGQNSPDPRPLAEAVPIWVVAPVHDGFAGDLEIRIRVAKHSEGDTLLLVFEDVPRSPILAMDAIEDPLRREIRLPGCDRECEVVERVRKRDVRKNGVVGSVRVVAKGRTTASSYMIVKSQ